MTPHIPPEVQPFGDNSPLMPQDPAVLTPPRQGGMTTGGPLMPAQPADPLKPYANELKELIRKRILMQVDSSRQFQLIMALRNELFWRAKQFLKFKFVNNGITVVPVSGPPGSSGVEPRNNQEPQALSYVFNITRSDGQKFVSIVGARAPNVNYSAKISQDPDSRKAARDAKAVDRYLDDLWDTERLQKDLARTIFRSGPQFGHIAWVTDPKKYGTVNVDQPGIVNGAIGVTGTQQFSKGMPEHHTYTIFDVTIPQERTKIKDCEWLHCEKLELSGKIRQLYGDLVANVKDEMPSGEDTPAQATVAEVYDIIASADPQQTNRTDRWWWSRTWLRPEEYHYAADGLKQLLQTQYADGTRIVFVNGNYVEGVQECMDDCWIVCKTGTDDRIMGDPICHDLIPINEIINNFFNLAIETVLRAIPKTIVNPRLVDRTAIQTNGANVAEVLFSKAGLSENLGDMVVKMPTATFSEQMMELVALFRTYSREIDGVMEAAFGGGDSAPTWRQDQQKKNQALAQFYVAYDEMRWYWVEAKKLGMALLAKYGMGTITVPSDDPFVFGPNVVDLTKLTPEKVKVEAEETMPETRAEESDRLVEQFQYPPQLQESLSVFHPINVPRISELLSLRGVTSIYVNLYEKTLKLIEQLLSTQPMQPPAQPAPIDPATGMQGPPPPPQPPQPSIQPDPFEFGGKNSGFAVEVVRAYLNSSAGLDQQQNNQGGYMNVSLFGQALDKMANPPAAPPPIKASVGVALSGKDLGSPAVQQALTGTGIIPANTPIIPAPEPPKIAPPGNLSPKHAAAA